MGIVFHVSGAATKGRQEKGPETLRLGKKFGDFFFSFYLHEASAVQKIVNSDSS